MFKNLILSRLMLPLALALLAPLTSANAVAVYTTQTRLLMVPSVNVPGLGSFQAQLIISDGDAALRVGTVLQLQQMVASASAVDLPASYQFGDQTVLLPALAVRAPDGSVSYFDVKLRNTSGGASPLTFVVDSMADTALGRSTAGATGAAGAAGPAGVAGPTGLLGATGAAGASGPAGPSGAAGPTGPAGLQGAVGAAGLSGASGKTVLNGTIDPAAAVGTDGDFYYNTSAKTFFGPKAAGAWPVTGTLLVGAAGAIGTMGPAGNVGPAGPAGAIGLRGDLGFKGDVGLTGPPGAMGLKGDAGVQGATGPAGLAGLGGAGGAVAGSSSSFEVKLTTRLDGRPEGQAFLPLNGYIKTAPTVIDLFDPFIPFISFDIFFPGSEAYAMAQPFPVATTLTKIRGGVRVHAALGVNQNYLKITATLYIIRLNNTGFFDRSSLPDPTPLVCVFPEISPFNNGSSLEASCVSTSGSVNVNAGDRGFIVFSATNLGAPSQGVSSVTVAASVSVAP